MRHREVAARQASCDYLQPGELLGSQIPDAYRRAWLAARPDSFSGIIPAAAARAVGA